MNGVDVSQPSPWMVALLLAALTLIVYLPAMDYDFVDLDDDVYVLENPRVQRGLTRENIAWSFTSLQAGFWHPLTWLSHMLDCQWFGLNPAGHHLSSVVIHTVNVVLLFWVFQLMTGGLWQSALVAGLFAVHPLNVESVAWIAERKNVLSTLFWLLTMWAYVKYCKGARLRRARQKAVWYLTMLLFFLLGMMAKPMLVTLPCVLLLLDYWPLGRMGQSWEELKQKFPPLVKEKAPLFVLALLAGLAAIVAQVQLRAMPSWEELPFDARLCNAVVAYTMYLSKMVWPAYLAVFYPHPGTSLPIWQVVLSSTVLGGISLLAFLGARAFPYVLVGWLWYLGTLFPVSGLLQVGRHAMADRYAYLSLIGLFVLLVWGLSDWLSHSRLRRRVWAPVLVALLFLLSLNTRLQLSYWRNGVTLLEHAIRSTENNHVAHNNLGTALLARGRAGAAVEQFYQALKIHPNNATALYNLGLALESQGKLEEAMDSFSQALQANPRLAPAHNNLGSILLSKGEFDEAIAHFRKALEIDPGLVRSYNNLGTALIRKGRWEEAYGHYLQALALDPSSYLTHFNLGTALLERGRLDEAARHFQRVIEIRPDFPDAYHRLMEIRQNQGETGKEQKND